MPISLMLWPLAALLAAVGLCRIAPRRTPGLHLWPVSCTALFICTLTAAVMAVLR